MDEKENKHKAFKLLILIFIGIMLFFLKEENQAKLAKYLGTFKMESRSLKLQNSVSMDMAEGDVALYDDNILLWKGNRLSRFKLNGDKVWEKEFNLDEPQAYFGRDQIYVYERPGGQIYIIDPEGESKEQFQLNINIYNLMEGNNGLLIHSKEEDIESINILDEEANLIGQKSIEGQNILTYSMDGNNELLALSTLNLKGESLRTEIQVFGVEGEFLWTVYLENEIAMYLKFDDDNNLIVVTDRGVYQIHEGNILWKKQFQLIKDIYMDEEYIHVLYENVLESLSFDGRTFAKNSFAEGYKKIVFNGDHIILYGDNYILGLKEGMEVFKFDSERAIERLLCGKGKLILIHKEGFDILSY